ncbi:MULTISPECIES: MaoC family dehydratase [unclassified Chelatococcus]|uniref:MaoC family dehydratase n=1 Tax=unclassified Chelatococcus TaxID=2638111 RepID=UPI001BCE18B1|nr:MULTISPECIES: MaoC family dehydratase [unclassified Chelatococcus]MBS7743440.1 MaoC family dehydratase [Chelatococcus sp. HY11]MBX3547183.1 MaoC family dehydratase [Chelatococcus sp.]CAH1663817.1 Acyl dehydratase [Hyphomicrobiales bacterium]CAH1687917.1 Acyl dehydratase [Hyphomicrobiales bacterium]
MIVVGDVIPPFRIVAKPEAMKEWADFLHDPNPIHLDPAVVHAKGLGDRVINQGPANVAYVMNALHRAFPGGAITMIDVRFLDNVYGGDEVEASGTVTEVTVVDGRKRIACDVTLRTLGRDLVLGGKAIIEQPSKPDQK